jgi:hypothetical protein
MIVAGWQKINAWLADTAIAADTKKSNKTKKKGFGDIQFWLDAFFTFGG